MRQLLKVKHIFHAVKYILHPSRTLMGTFRDPAIGYWRNQFSNLSTTRGKATGQLADRAVHVHCKQQYLQLTAVMCTVNNNNIYNNNINKHNDINRHKLEYSVFGNTHNPDIFIKPERRETERVRSTAISITIL